MELPPDALMNGLGSSTVNRRVTENINGAESVTQPPPFPLLSSLLGISEEQRRDTYEEAVQLIDESKLGCLTLLKPPASGNTFSETVEWYCNNIEDSEEYEVGFIDSPNEKGTELGLGPDWIIIQSNMVTGSGESVGFRYYPNIYSAVKYETQQALFGLCILKEEIEGTQRQDWIPAAELQYRKAFLLLQWLDTSDNILAGCNYAKEIISDFGEKNINLFATISDYIQTEYFFDRRRPTGINGARETHFENYMTKFDQQIWSLDSDNPDEWAWVLARLPSSIEGI